jgi:hypothetical protein
VAAIVVVEVLRKNLVEHARSHSESPLIHSDLSACSTSTRDALAAGKSEARTAAMTSRKDR